MRRILYGVILLAAFFAPVERLDVAKLLPVEAVAIYLEEGQVVLETDSEDRGRGDTVQAALENLKQNATKIIYLDTARRAIAAMPEPLQHFFLAPLLVEASIHTNTSGVFKGFYKNRNGIGQFGGEGRNALRRILADIRLPLPVFSHFECCCHILQQDATAAAHSIPELDVAYLDPPYNQHPYASNYFMLNFLLDYRKPERLSPVSGIPEGWNHSAYNSRRHVAEALLKLLSAIRAPFVLLSYNSEGFICPRDMQQLLKPDWKVSLIEQEYATFRGCRNLRNRALTVKELLYLLERR